MAAKAILSAAVLFAIALPLAMAKFEFIGIIIMELVTLGMLTALGWIDPLFLLVIALLIAALWARKIASWITGLRGD